MRRIAATLVLILSGPGAFGDVGLSLGGAGALTVPGASPEAEVTGGASADLFHPLDGGGALLADAAAEVRYLPADSAVVASGAVSGDLSLDRGSLLARFEIAALGEASAAWGGAAAADPTGEASASFLASWGGATATVEGEAVVRILGGARVSWGPSIRVGLSGVSAGGLILSADGTCDLDVLAEGSVEPVLGLVLTAEWLPEAPIVLRAEATIERRYSEAVEDILLDASAVDVAGYWGYLEIGSSIGMSAIVGRKVDLTLDVGGSFRLSDHGVITESEVLAEREWRAEIKPALTVGLDLSRRLGLSLTIEDLVQLSNAEATAHRLAGGIQLRLDLP